jgi:putative nucleotidyltransferase with HDIG domain
MTVSNKRLIALVDADENHRQKVTRGLMSYYDMRVFSDTERALDELLQKPPILILINSTTKPETSVDFIRRLKQNETLKDISVIYIAASETDENIETAKAVGADSTITKPYPISTLIRTISQELNENIEDQWEALPTVQRNALRNSVDVFHNIADVLMTGESVSFTKIKSNCQPLVDVIESHDFDSILDGVKDHDDYTYAHSMRVATFLSVLGHHAGFSNEEQLMLASGGLLHDVGKMMIPHSILNKPGRLNDKEFEIIKSHVPETIKYLKKSGDIPDSVFIIAEQHHEKIDGTGYPHGLKGKELNELARMAAVVDVFSALTDRRVYKDPMPMDKALTIMKDEMTTHLDQNFVRMFEAILRDSDGLTFKDSNM